MKITQTNPIRTIETAVKKYVEFLAPTYGPAGKSILIATNPLNIKSVDDGAEASKEFEIENEHENAVISYIKGVTEKTNERVGDGTTTSVILASAIVEQVMKDNDNPFTSKNFHAKALEIKKATLEAIAELKSKAKDIKTKKELYAIAYNSFNNEKIATIISDTLFAIGKDGLLVVEDSQTVDTEIEVVKGLELAKGFASPYFINNDKQESTLSNPAVVVCQARIELFNEIIPLVKQIVESGKKDILFIAEGFGEDVLNGIILNRIQGRFNALAIEAPGFGITKEDTIKDIAAVTGAKLIDGKIVKLKEATLELIGACKKVIAKKDKTTIIDGMGNKEELAKHVEIVRQDLEKQTIKGFEQERLQKRLATLTGGMALIKVGANTENEQKTIKAKVEDAVNATKVAFKDGIVKGAGVAYASIKTSSPILNEVLKAPRKQLEENGAEYLDENVTDPAGVLIAALETATSIACGLITIGGIITNKREKKDREVFDY